MLAHMAAPNLQLMWYCTPHHVVAPHLRRFRVDSDHTLHVKADETASQMDANDQLLERYLRGQLMVRGRVGAICCSSVVSGLPC